MGGFHDGLRRAAMILAIAASFGIPSTARAQAPSVEDERLPWQTGEVFAKEPFSDAWARVLSDTARVLKVFSDLSRYAGPPAITPVAELEVGPIWGPDFRTYIPATPDQPTIQIGSVRATLMPIEISSTVVAESRGIHAVLVGAQVELPEIE